MIRILLIVGLVSWTGCNDARPMWLSRHSAESAIRQSSRFQHQTTVVFEIGQFEGLFPGVCHNFGIAPDKLAAVDQLRRNGRLQFSPFGSQLPPYQIASTGTYQLADRGFLVDAIAKCQPKQVQPSVGRYELKLGDPQVRVTGIFKTGNVARVDFLWNFDGLNPIGKDLAMIEIQAENESNDNHATQFDKSFAPYWRGTAGFSRYDDGWRITSLELSWTLGPTWPDQEFTWPAPDEDENVWIHR